MSEEILAGDVVIDLSQGIPLQVVSQSTKTAGEHEYTRGDRVAEMFGVEADEPVYECVFLPTPEDQISPPKRTYSYPESRLVRFPSEAGTTLDRLQTELRSRALRSLVDAADEDLRGAILALVEDVYDDRTADLLAELAEARGVSRGETT
ncbi:MAG: hypothetical protein ABEJ76_08860 [Halanaeroarchaeum sp.]